VGVDLRLANLPGPVGTRGELLSLPGQHAAGVEQIEVTPPPITPHRGLPFGSWDWSTSPTVIDERIAY
jgi:hypothetical protein